MNWNESKKSTALSSDSSEHSSGDWCLFIPLSSTEAVKLYPTAKIRDEAWLLQALAHDVDCAPAVGDTCDMPFIDSWKIPSRWSDLVGENPTMAYGFVTEIVSCDNLSEEEQEELLEKCSMHGITIRDTNYGKYNCGLRSDGVPVRYDFDPGYYDPDTYSCFLYPEND